MRGLISVIICRLYIKNIDYNSVVERLMPVITKELTELDNVYSTIIKKIISKNDKPRTLTKLVVAMVPNKDELAVSLLQQYSEDIRKYANNALRNLMINAEIKSLRGRAVEKACGREIRIEVTIDDIDYEQTAANLMPLVLNLIKKDNKMAEKALSIITKNYQTIESMLKAALKDLPAEKKDELLVSILKEFNGEIIDAANQAIEKNKIKAEIRDIEFQTKFCHELI